MYTPLCTWIYLSTNPNKHRRGSVSTRTHTHAMYIHYSLPIDENASPNTRKPLCLSLQTHLHAQLYGSLCLYTGMYLCAHLYWSTPFLSKAPLCIDTQKFKLLDTRLCAHTPLFTYTYIPACM